LCDYIETSSIGLQPTGQLLVLHSQTNVIPDCPDGLPHVLSGYSYLQSTHSIYGAATQDLGSVGSCLIYFTTEICAETDCASYWLASNVTAKSLSPVDMKKTVSRCSVCLLTSNILTLHSMNSELPSCPQGWDILWDGYSFVRVSIQFLVVLL